MPGTSRVFRHCPYANCNLGCNSVTQHKAKYAKMKDLEIESIIEHGKSPKIDYNAAIAIGLLQK